MSCSTKVLFELFIMSKTSLHLVGDSNVIRYLPLVKSVKDDPYIQESTMSRAVNVVQLEEALTSPAKVTPIVIIAALTNPIISYPFEDYSGMLKHCEKFFSQVKAWIVAGRSALPGAFEKVTYVFCPLYFILYVVLLS